MSEIVERQMLYWNEFLARTQRSSNKIAGARGPYKSTSNELLVNIGGGSGIDLRAWMNRREGFIAVALYLYDAGKHNAYRQLEMKRSTIDDALGDQASEWLPPGLGRPAGYVATTKKYADPMDEADWETQFVWLQEKLARFDTVFRPIVKQL